MNKFYIGKFKEDASQKEGWIVGSFAEGARKTDKIEVKYWEFPKGPTTHKSKTQKQAIECTIILEGKMKGFIGEEKIELQAGDYVVIPPGIKSNFPEYVLEDVKGITIKSPSIKDDIEGR